MANDLERFLQQAAQRLAEKVNQAGNPKPANQPPRNPPVRQAERMRQRMDVDVVDAEIVDADEARKLREAGPNPLSSLDTRPGLAQEISLSDERMTAHLHDVFDHNVSNLKRASTALSVPQGETEKTIEVQRRSQNVSPFVETMFRSASLASLFLASEIFKKKF